MEIEFAQLGLFVVATLILNLTPGPDMLFTAANGMHGGAKAGVASAVGVGLGGLVHAGLAAIGVSALIATSDLAFDILRFSGAAYLVWIGFKTIKGGQDKLNNPSALRLSYKSLLMRGFITNIFNPKVILFFIAFIPQFVNPASANLALELFMLGCFVASCGTIINGLVGVFAGSAGKALLQNPQSAKWIARVSGSLFVALGLRLVFIERN
ncbi:MAG: LysE family translocator [Sneathiella sp.]